MIRIGILSDTHGTLDPSVIEALSGVDHIIHAGDIGGVDVLLELEAVASVTAVKGNMDGWGALPGIRERETPLIDGVRFVVMHDLHELRRRGMPSDARVVVSGHTHIACVEWEGERLFVNPGSPSRPRRNGPTIVLVELECDRVDARIVRLQRTA